MENIAGPASKKQKTTILDAFISREDDFKLVRLTYISRPTRTLAEEEKEDLLNVAKKRNAEMNISGILFLAEDMYLQTLEGPRRALVDLLQRLNRDGRHTTLTITSVEYIEQRIYPKWSMERVKLSEDSLFIMNNLFNTIISSFDVLRQYSQQSIIMDWLTNGEVTKEEPEKTTVEEVVLFCELINYGVSFKDQMDIKNYINFINKFIKTCSDVITGLRGQFIRYVGDSCLGTFPLDSVEDAVKAAVEIQRLIGIIRDKTTADSVEPERVLYVGIGIAMGESLVVDKSEEELDVPQSAQDAAFLAFFGGNTSKSKTKKSVFSAFSQPNPKEIGYDIYPSEALDQACQLKRATTYYRLPILMTERAKVAYTNARKKALGLMKHDNLAVSAPGSTPFTFNPSTAITNSPLPTTIAAFSFFTPTDPNIETEKKEIEISLVGTVRLPVSAASTDSGPSAKEETVNVYAPEATYDKDCLRDAAERILEWKRSIEQRKFS